MQVLGKGELNAGSTDLSSIAARSNTLEKPVKRN